MDISRRIKKYQSLLMFIIVIILCLPLTGMSYQIKSINVIKRGVEKYEYIPGLGSRTSRPVMLRVTFECVHSNKLEYVDIESYQIYNKWGEWETNTDFRGGEREEKIIERCQKSRQEEEEREEGLAQGLIHKQNKQREDLQQKNLIKLPFDKYPISTIYKNKKVFPDFKGREKKYSNYRTRIREGFKEGVNFAGHYKIIEIGCGTNCIFSYIGNISTGEVFDVPNGGEDTPNLKQFYKKKSNLLIQIWPVELTDYSKGCYREDFEMKNNSFVSLGKKLIKNEEECNGY